MLRFSTAALISMLLAFLALTSFSDEQMKPSEKDRCPVCGMYPDQYPNWIASVTFRDGKRVFFDGPKDLFRYYLDLAKYEKEQTKEDLSEIQVTDYYSTKPIPARQAFYVIGSNVRGPMGKDLVPMKEKAQAETFLKDHNGEKILDFDEVTSSVLSELK